jgi:hypothetical protein
LIVNLSDCTRAVSSVGKLADWLPVTESIVQGSGIGPMLYILFASDLKLRSAMNFLCNYADDTTLMVPDNTDVFLEDECKHIV